MCLSFQVTVTETCDPGNSLVLTTRIGKAAH